MAKTTRPTTMGNTASGTPGTRTGTDYDWATNIPTFSPQIGTGFGMPGAGVSVDDWAPFTSPGKLYKEGTIGTDAWDPWGVLSPAQSQIAGSFASGLDLPYGDQTYAGDFRDDIASRPWGKLAFAAGPTTGQINYEDAIKDSFDMYVSNVKGMFDAYYGPGTGQKWKTYAGAQGEGAWRPGSATYQPFGPTGDDDAPFAYDVSTADPTGTQSSLGKYYKDYASALSTEAGDWAPEGWDYGALSQYGSTATGGDSLYHQLAAGTIDPTDAIGGQTEAYLEGRKATIAGFFGEDVPAGWDPSAPTAGWQPTLADGVTPVTVESDVDDIDDAITKYGADTTMGAYLTRLKTDKTALEKYDPIETGAYKGMFKDEETMLTTLFGTGGTEASPTTTGSFADARSRIQEVTSEFYDNPQFGEAALRDAVTNSATGEQNAQENWDAIEESLGQGFFGATTFTADQLASTYGTDGITTFITIDPITGKYTSNFDTAAGSAVAPSGATGDDIPLENESELGYELRMYMGEMNQTGTMAVYTQAYEDRIDQKETTIENLQNTFQSEFDTAASAYGKGQQQIKQDQAKAHGLRMGTQKRLSQQLKTDLADSFEEDKITFGDDMEDEQKAFEAAVESTSSQLVSAWETGYGGEGTSQVAKEAYNKILGQIYGTYTYTYTPTGGTEPITVTMPHTKETIDQVLASGDFVANTTVQIDVDGDGTMENVVLVDEGTWGKAVDVYKSAKLGAFGTGAGAAARKGWAPGPDKMFGTADDEKYTGAPDLTNLAGDPSYGWETGLLGTEVAGGLGYGQTPGDEGYEGLPTELLDSLGELTSTSAYGDPLEEHLTAYGTAFSDTGEYGTPSGYAAPTTEAGSILEQYEGVRGATVDAAEGTFGAIAPKIVEERAKAVTALQTATEQGTMLSQAGGLADVFKAGGEEYQQVVGDKSFTADAQEQQDYTMGDWDKMFSDQGVSADKPESIYNAVEQFKDASQGAAESWLGNLSTIIADSTLMDIYSPEGSMTWGEKDGLVRYMEKPEDPESDPFNWMTVAAFTWVGSEIGSAVPVVGTILGAGIGFVVGVVAELFTSDPTHCCTAAQKYYGMSKMKVVKLRAWHRKQSKIWQKGYDIWGKILADRFVSKYKWAAKGTEGFYEWFVKKNKTFYGALAIAFIYPGSYLIGASILIKDYLVREKGKDYATT